MFRSHALIKYHATGGSNREVEGTSSSSVLSMPSKEMP